MTVKKILELGNPILRTSSANIIFPLMNEDQQLLIDLKCTLHDFKKNTGFGRGIAAPQIGVLKNAICIDMGTPQYYINPRIIRYSEDYINLYDDCFSMPGIKVLIRRSKTITVEYYDDKGSYYCNEYTGDMSELLQHEIDHLNGILAIDRASSTKDIWSFSEWKKIQNYQTDV